ISDGNGKPDVYLWNRASDAIALVSASAPTAGATASDMSFAPHVSDDGSVVEFASWATDLVSGQVDANVFPDVFVFDVASAQNALVSHAFGAPNTSCDSGGTNTVSGAVLSGDGSTIAFTSSATNLVGTPVAGGQPNIYRYLIGSGANTLVSHAAGTPGVAANGFAGVPSLSR